MKMLITIISLVWLTGCATGNKMSSDESVIKTVITHGCDPSEVNVNRVLQKMQVRCKSHVKHTE